MVEGIVFVFKGLILTEVLTRAARTWGIFDPLRSWLKFQSSFLRRLLDCFECTSVWAAALVVSYLMWFEVPLLTWLLIFHRLACFVQVVYDYLDALRAKKEGEI